MKIQIVRDEVTFDSLKDQWNKIAELSDTFIFQTYEWNRIWWKHFGKQGKLHLILFYSENRLTGIAPLFQDTIQISGKTICASLRFLGSDVSQPEGEALIGLGSYSDYLDLIVMPGYEKRVARELAEFLLCEKLPHDQIILDEVQHNSIVMQFLIPALNNTGIHVETANSSTCTNITLDPSWEFYLNRLSKNSRKKAKKYLNVLDNDTASYLKLKSIGSYDELYVAFENLVSVHQKQWNRKGFPGTFYEKRMYEFTRDICFEFYKNNWLLIENLTAINDGNKVINAEMFFVYKGRIYSVHGGTDPDSAYRCMGAGNITFTKVLKNAIESGYKIFDYLRGLEDYKVRRVDQFLMNKTVFIRNPRGRRSLLIPLLRQNVRMLRRARVEVIQAGLIFENKRFLDGILAYKSFWNQRLARKNSQIPDQQLIYNCSTIDSRPVDSYHINYQPVDSNHGDDSASNRQPDESQLICMSETEI